MALKNVDESIEYVSANNGVQALKILESDKSFIPDFIFIDVNMPKMNGFICLGEIKKISRLGNSRIIMYSTTADPNSIKKSMDLGAGDFLVKPTRVGILIEKLTTILMGHSPTR